MDNLHVWYIPDIGKAHFLFNISWNPVVNFETVQLLKPFNVWHSQSLFNGEIAGFVNSNHAQQVVYVIELPNMRYFVRGIYGMSAEKH